MTIAAPRWPLEPVRHFYGALSGRTLSAALGIPETTLRRWGREGIPDDRADALACALGAHPSELWPQWLESGDDGEA